MKILITGWFGAGNMGDEAILLSELLSLRAKIGEAEFYIITFGYERTRRLTANMPEVRKILRMGSVHNILQSDFLEILKAFKEVDVVVIGGGGIFQDIYNHYPIPFFTGMALLARFYKKLLVFYSVGIGPVNTFIGKRLCKLAFDAADIVSVRDEGSRDLLKGLGITKEVYLSADPVFMLRPLWDKEVEDVIRKYDLGGEAPIIGVCVQDLLSWEDRTRKVLAEALDILNIEKGARILFLPMGRYKEGRFRKGALDTVDITASKRLSGFMKGRYSILSEELSPPEFLSVVERMSLIISMRLHGVIMGLSMHVPVVALTYREESKIKGLMMRIGQEGCLFDIRDFVMREFLDKINSLLSEKERVIREIKEIVSFLRTEIEGNNEMLFKTLMDNASKGLYRKSAINCDRRSRGNEAKFV